MKRPTKRASRRNAAAKALAKGRYRQRIVRNRKIYTRKGRRPQDSGLSSLITMPTTREMPDKRAYLLALFSHSNASCIP